MLYEGTVKQDFDLPPTTKQPNIAKRKKTVLKTQP